MATKDLFHYTNRKADKWMSNTELKHMTKKYLENIKSGGAIGVGYAP